MNQDARLVQCDEIYSIIYNVFEDGGIKLRYRDIVITDNEIQLSNERYLFSHIYRPVEKHCSFAESRNIIHYGMGEHFELLINDTLHRKRINHFDYLYQKYGHSNVIVSVSTPSITWTNGSRLSCGHVKILYKKIHNFDFLTGIDLKQIHTHGKYIYFMYLYEFCNDKIINVSLFSYLQLKIVTYHTYW